MTRVHVEIPDDLHRKAKAAAALEGVTLKDFVIKALEVAVEPAKTQRKR
jgi:predicted HicB family RNase H-like nuclease